MHKFKVEIPIILITIIILTMLALSGKEVYKSLSRIVDSMLTEARPDHKLMLAKDISSDLNELENAVKLYSLSENKTYLSTYSDLNNSLASKLTELQKYASNDSTDIQSTDSLVFLANQKITIWKNILNMYLSKKDEHDAFMQYSERLDTMVVAKDTFYYPEEEKVGFLKKVFSKKKEPPRPVIVDRTEEKQSMQEEITRLENEISKRNKQISSREAAYTSKSQEISEALTALISKLELREQEQLVQKTQDADLLATETYKRLAWFALAVFLLMIFVLFLFLRDLRKSRKYQTALKKAKTEAESLARTKEIFAATVSHEMRTPVSAIYGLSEQLLQQPHDKKTQKDLEIIHQSTKHLIDLVNDTFDFTRIENQQFQLQPVNFLLRDLIDYVEIHHRTIAENKGIQFVVNKNIKENHVVFSDESRLKQILNNLLTNAIKFTDQGSVKLNVSSISNDEQETLQFEISDTGIGIPKNKQDHIFKDFVQLDTDINKKAGGTGLGLYIVKKLVKLLKGQIKLESQPGIGTTFTVTLPVQKGDSSQLQKTFTGYSAPETLKGKKILIVDDEEFNRHLLRNILTKWNIDFDEAENGQQAIDLAEKLPFALILMDIRMPVLSGTEATQKLKAAGNPAKIIGLSANTNESETKKYLESGFDNYLKKPFNEAGLYNVIDQTLRAGAFQNEDKNESDTELKADLSDLLKMGNGDPNFVKEMIEIFLTSSNKSMQSMQENIQNKNWQSVADHAHKLAAPTKHLNASEVYKTLKRLQNLAENEADSTVIEKVFDQLNTEINALNENLQNLLKKNLNTLSAKL